MAIVFSYRWNRNPSRLLRAFGLSVHSAREEAAFLRALDDAPDDVPGHLCLVMGGFTDGFLGRAYALLGDVHGRLGRGFDIYYREHDEHAGTRRVLRRYGELGRRVVLIGHSWGASSLARDVLPALPHVRTDALITLDPVGLRGPVPLPSVRRWLNVYIPYERAAWSRENNVARLGRPWEYVREADMNRIPSQLRHADALGMFREYGATFLTLALMQRS
ncbi:alpha/beta fold hydrolase [uncultured Mailhella sp.]|uniref:alpha/beta fold hydrolase n=1 Tax=uncultured Mailhella sp. TaxID=1981031 RepID=UPI0025CEAA47|nr:alpha/beta fold hydrolase [uncultured Mailhella sp.]